MSKFFEFSQNNSGGHFTIDDARGLGPKVWVEADDTEHANYRAGRIGIYFDGCADGRDCSCCGDRWYEAWGDGEDAPDINPEYDFHWHDAVYVHRLDGSIERLKSSPANSLP